jgi:KipI family sensor histidine kinase inhibitor
MLPDCFFFLSSLGQNRLASGPTTVYFSFRMEITPLGDSALILHVRDSFEEAPDKTLDEVLGYYDFLRRAGLPAVTELAPAYTTVAIFYDPARAIAAGAAPNKIVEWLSELVQTSLAKGDVHLERATSTPIEIPVCYDDRFALDLDDVTRHAGLSPQAVIDLHTRALYRVSCLGFTPGFPYLSGLPQQLATPRRSVPRREVPAGSVAIGGSQTGIYPMRSPGGWNIIGRTPLRLFSPKKNPPVLLCPGDHVRFQAISIDEFESWKR